MWICVNILSCFEVEDRHLKEEEEKRIQAEKEVHYHLFSDSHNMFGQNKGKKSSKGRELYGIVPYS